MTYVMAAGSNKKLWSLEEGVIERAIRIEIGVQRS